MEERTVNGDTVNLQGNGQGESFSSEGLKQKSGLRITPKSAAQKKREQADFKRRYFDYYDDVKTNIKEDW